MDKKTKVVNAFNDAAEALVSKLPVAVQPYAKAFIPAILSVIILGLSQVGVEIDDTLSLGGLAAAIITLIFPNKN